MKKEIEIFDIQEERMRKMLREGELPRNWSSDVMKAVWGEDLASRLNDNQNRK